MKYQHLRTAVIALSLLAASAGCTSFIDRSSSTDITLLRLKPTNPPRSILAVGYEGILQIRSGCIYLIDKQGEDTLLLWPEAFQLWTKKGKVVGIQDTESGRVLRFDQIKTLMGGGVMTIPASELISPIPSRCKGPMAYVSFDNP